MRLTQKLKDFRDLIAPTCDTVYHYWRQDKTYPCIVWEEDGEDTSFFVDNRKKAQALSGSLHYFTHTEYDETIDAIQEALDGSPEVVFAINSVQFEDDTNLIHYEWRWIIYG